MQFQSLSQSFGTSLPRDQFVIQALSRPEGADGPAPGKDRDINVTEDDEREERELRRRDRQRQREHKQRSRSRRPSTLHSFMSFGDRDDIDESRDEEAFLDDDSLISTEDEEEDRDSIDGRAGGSQDAQVPEYLHPTTSTSPVRPSAGRKASSASLKGTSPSTLAPPPTEATPLLGPGGRDRKASVSTLTPKPLPGVPGPAVNASRKEITILVWYTIPIFLTHLLEYSLLLATIVSVGHLGTAELAASSLGSMTTNVCALSLIQGLCAALDTLCSQSYSSPNPKLTSLHALRTMFLIVLILIPATAVIYNGERVLLALNQDPEVAHLAGKYLRVLIFGIPGYAGFEVTRRWLQAQGLMVIPTLSLVIASPINIFLNWLLVWGPDSVRLGFIGAPLSTAISFNLMFIITIIYCIFFAPRDAWGGFTVDMFKGLKANLILGAAGFISVASEWWAWEIVGISSAYLGTANLGANSVLGTSASLLYQLPYGLSVAAAVRVGNLVGAQMPFAARTSASMAWLLSLVIGGINSSLLLIFKNRWGRLFSSDEEVVAIVASVMPLVGLFQLADGITIASMGILRGTGYATLGAQINVLAYWVIGLPIGLALTFSRIQWKLFGLWTGLTIALVVTATASSIVIFRIKWKDAVQEVKEHTEGPEVPPLSSAILGKDNDTSEE